MPELSRRNSELRSLGRPFFRRLAGLVGMACACCLCFGPQNLAAQPATPPATKPAAAPGEEAAPVEEENTNSLKSLEELTYPTAEEFLKETKFKDWLVLKKDKKVIPVLAQYGKYPRPGTIAAWDAALKRGIPQGIKNEKRLRESLPYLNVTLDSALAPENPEYHILRKFVEDIVYYEDMLLQRIDETLDKKQVRQAYELLDRLEQSSPNWAGADLRRQRLLFVEAGLRLSSGDLEMGLAMLQNLHAMSKNYPQLSVTLGEVIDALVTKALEVPDYRRARHFLDRLRRMDERHLVLLKWTKDLEARATEKIRLAEAASRAGKPAEAIDRIEEAAHIWPLASELQFAHRQLFQNYQRLRVGTIDAPSEKGTGPYVLAADLRQKDLIRPRLFQPARMDDSIVRYETRFFTEWEPASLGHSIQFKMLQHRGASESQPAITSGTVVETIASRLDPLRPEYDARIASSVEFLSVSSPFEFRVNFRQAPLRPEALFSIPLEMSGAAGTLAPNGTPSWPFYLHSHEGRNTTYRRSRPEPAQSTDRHVAEIIETKYDNYAASVQGLIRGDVSMLPRILPEDEQKFEKQGDFFVHISPLPETHILQFHPRSQPLKSRTLRRALVYSLNRQLMLESIFLKEPEGRLGRLTSGPFATKSYAYNPTVKPHRFDPILGYSLVLGAKSELKQLPTLKMICPNDPQIRTAAKEMADHWTRIFEKQGLKVTLLDAPPAGTVAGQIANVSAKGAEGTEPPPEWDIRYEVVRMSEPLVELWPVVALTTATDITSIQHIPTWLRQELLMLEQAGDMTSAEEILRRLHKHIWAEVHLIPLWELNPLRVIRKNIRRVSTVPLNVYQDVDGWQIEPWYPREAIERAIITEEKRP